MVDDLEDSDFVNNEQEMGFSSRTDMYEFRDVLQTGDRWKLSDDVLSLIINQTLAVVSRDDKFVSPSTVNKWRKQLAEEAKLEYEKKQKQLVCLDIDGKTMAESIGHNQSVRKHHLVFIEEPGFKYVDHKPSGENALAMSTCTMGVIEGTESSESLLTIGASN